MLNKSGADATEQIQQIEFIKQESTEKGTSVGNFMSDSFPNSSDEVNNVVNEVWGEKLVATLCQTLKNHVDLLGIVDTKTGANAGDIIHDSVRISNEENIVVTEVWGKKRVFPPGQKPTSYAHLFELPGVGDTQKGTSVGNLMPDWNSFVEENNVVTGVWGEKQVAPPAKTLKNHLDLFELLGIVDTKTGANAGDLIHDSIRISNEENIVVTEVWGKERVFPPGEKPYSYAHLFELPHVGDTKKGTSVGNLMPDSVPNSIDESNEETQQHVLKLYSILTATERTISYILQNYQQEDGVEIPELLQPLMDGKTFLHFKATKNKD